MPRPKSELTGVRPFDLSARLTDEQRTAYTRLGGSRWLREAIEREINKAGGAHQIPRPEWADKADKSIVRELKASSKDTTPCTQSNKAKKTEKTSCASLSGTAAKVE